MREGFEGDARRLGRACDGLWRVRACVHASHRVGLLYSNVAAFEYLKHAKGRLHATRGGRTVECIDELFKQNRYGMPSRTQL